MNRQTIQGFILSSLFPYIFIIGNGCSGGGGAPTPHSPNEKPDYDNHRSVGASAYDLLSADKYTSITVEIQAMTGFGPTSTTIDNLKRFVTSRCNKSSVSVVSDSDIAAQGKPSYSLDDARQIEADNRQFFSTGTTLYVYFLFLDGDSTDNSGNSKILAYAYQNTSIAVFEKTIRGLSGGLGQPSTTVLESTVNDHEFGHVMGLVNIGSPMQTSHQDTEHGNHCNVSSPTCLMYYTVNTSDFITNLLTFGGSIPTLDSQCNADLVANGGKP